MVHLSGNPGAPSHRARTWFSRSSEHQGVARYQRRYREEGARVGLPGRTRRSAPQMPIHVTKLEYRVWRQPDAHPDDEIVQMKSHMSVADFHFRLNAQESGIHPSSIATRIQWTGEAECSFTIEAPATEDQLSGAWKTAAEMIDLQTVLATKPH